MRGNADPTFMDRINGIVLCLATACLYHALKAWNTGTFVQAPDFTLATAGGRFKIHISSDGMLILSQTFTDASWPHGDVCQRECAPK